MVNIFCFYWLLALKIHLRATAKVGKTTALTIFSIHMQPRTLQAAGSSTAVLARIGLAVMGLSFAGHLSPEVRLQWANFSALCGF
ncbi:MAG: hypothetical protein WBF88_10865 [Pusillimonas sp.]